MLQRINTENSLFSTPRDLPNLPETIFKIKYETARFIKHISTPQKEMETSSDKMSFLINTAEGEKPFPFNVTTFGSAVHQILSLPLNLLPVMRSFV